MKVIAIVNLKGGVGKSTLANLLELPNKIIINLDLAQDAQKINLTNSTFNFYELQEEWGIESVEEAIEGAKESGKEFVILDTPGEIQEFLDSLIHVDHFIVPFTFGERSSDTTLRTIETIDAYLNATLDKRKDSWCLILNKYSNDEHLQELDELYTKAKSILGERLLCKSSLKFSQVVPTIERTRMTINDLIKQNPIAYGVFKKRITKMNEDIKNFLEQ